MRSRVLQTLRVQGSRQKRPSCCTVPLSCEVVPSLGSSSERIIHAKTMAICFRASKLGPCPRNISMALRDCVTMHGNLVPCRAVSGCPLARCLGRTPMGNPNGVTQMGYLALLYVLALWTL